MYRFFSKWMPTGAPGRVPVLAVALGLGALLITGGIALRAEQNEAVAIAYAATSTALAPTLTPSITSTNTLTPTATDTPTVTSTPTRTPTGTLPPTQTPTPTETASPTPVPASTVRINSPTPDPEQTGEPAPIPAMVPAIEVPRGVENIMLLGSDLRPDLHEANLTDTIIIVSINQREGTVNMLSIPRDLYVYVPGWEVVKINTVYGHGQAVGSEGGGPGLLARTLLYNFGIQVHHYALVDLSGFRSIVDLIGGIDVPVNCNYTGFRLEQPALDQDDFDSYEAYVDYTDPESGNWEVHTLPIGVHHLDGYMALWYARFRKGSSDFERASRQQQVLRAILTQARDAGMVNVVRLPQLWNEYNDLVQTDMGLGNMLEMVPIATDLEPNEIGQYTIADLLVGYSPPTGVFAGQAGYIVNPENPEFIQQRIEAAMGPPAQTVIQLSSPVEIRNGTEHERLDEVAADELAARFSMLTVPTGPAVDAADLDKTVIYDYTGQQKTNQLVQIQRMLHVADVNVISQPDPNRTVDYVVVLGEDYYEKLQQCLRIDPDTQVGTPTPGAPTSTREP